MVRMLAISEVSGPSLIVSKPYTATLAEARELSSSLAIHAIDSFVCFCSSAAKSIFNGSLSKRRLRASRRCFQKGTRPTEEQIQVWNGYMSNRGWSDGLSAFVVGPHLPLVKKKTPASGPVAAVYDCRRLLLDLPLWRLSMTAEENDRIMDDRIFFFVGAKNCKTPSGLVAACLWLLLDSAFLHHNAAVAYPQTPEIPNQERSVSNVFLNYE